MLPIIKFAKDYEIQWKTVQLIAIEIFSDHAAKRMLYNLGS